MKTGYVIYNAMGQILDQRMVWVSSTEDHRAGRQFIHPLEAMYAIDALSKLFHIKPVLKMKASQTEDGLTVLTGEADGF
jgi:hypothetical protein